jgi:hypothetical protein
LIVINLTGLALQVVCTSSKQFIQVNKPVRFAIKKVGPDRNRGPFCLPLKPQKIDLLCSERVITRHYCHGNSDRSDKKMEVKD